MIYTWKNKSIKNMMIRKGRMKIVNVIIFCLFVMILCPCSVRADNIFYSNENGVVLSKQEYLCVIQYISEDDLDLFSQTELSYIMENPSERVEETSTIYSKTTYLKGMGPGTSVEYLSEQEMFDSINIRDNTISKNTYSFSDRTDTHTTAMKKITMNMYEVGGSVKKVILTCTWLSLPIVRSYDVLAMRPVGNSVTIDTLGTNNVVGYQIYDGHTITYSSSSSNFKYTNSGLGLSLDLEDNVSSSLVLKLNVIFETTQDPFQVYGTYQHAVKNISLSNSKKYTIGAGGMGDVLNFTSGYSSYYDNTGGVMVRGSLDDY